jgi:pimeloyl-ACP methyl ester carboxylesterase
MPFARNGDVELYYETFGFDDGPALVLVAGLGNQLLAWPEELCQGLVDRGFFVVRFDNRDVGLSTILPDGARYTLSDMAADVVAVLDAAQIESAHVVGQSLGGMIAQTVAIEHPDRVSSLTSISSSTGNPNVGIPSEAALAALLRPAVFDPAEAVEADVNARRVWASPAWFDEEMAREYFTAAHARSFNPGAGARQFEAIVSSGERDAGLRELTIPVLVVHGDSDVLVAPSGGEHTAALVAGSTHLVLEGMGHDLPAQVWQPLISAITAHVASTYA